MNNPWLTLPLFALLVLSTRTLGADDDHDHDHGLAPTSAPKVTAPAITPAHDANRHHDDHDDHDHGAALPITPATSPRAKDDHGHEQDHDPHDPAAAATDPHAVGDAHDDHGHGDEHDEHADEVTLTAEAIERNGIKVGKAERRVLTNLIVSPGRLAFDAEAMAHVGSAVRGRATEIKVRVGDVVKKGDELLIIESPELGEAQSDVLQKRIALVVAKASVEPTKNAYERAKTLHEKSEGIALAEVQRREVEFRAATGAVQTAEQAFATAANRLRLLGMVPADVEELLRTGLINPKLSVRAPLTGTVIEREVTLGELVAPEDERLLVLAATDHLWAIADVPEARLGDLTVGATADVAVGATLEARITGKVTHIAPSVDVGTRTARVRIDIPNTDGKLRPGMFARVAITGTGAGKPVVVVPDEAVQTVEGGPAVFVPAHEPNTFAKRAVTVGKAVAGLVPIFDGLKEGDAVVTSGTFILKADLGKSGAAHEH